MNATDLLIEPPRELRKSYQREYWRRICLAVITLAETGIATASELANNLAFHFGINPTSCPIRRLIHKTLPDDGFTQNTILPVARHIKLTAIQLTDYGKDIARALGVEPIENEYERILRLHDGEKQPKHTAQVLFTAYQARMRGFGVKVMPFEKSDGKPWYQPDLTLRDPIAGRFYPVEVETHSRNKPEKWQGKREPNIVFPNPQTRLLVVQRLKDWGIHGRATDLQTLARQARQGILEYFWLEYW